MRKAPILLLVGILLLVPAVISDGSEAVNRYDVVFFDLTSHEMAEAEVKEGDTVAWSAAYIWNQYPYWYDIDTGYKWDGDTPVTCDLHLHASETEPPSKPQETDLVPYIGIATVLALVVVAGIVTVKGKT